MKNSLIIITLLLTLTASGQTKIQAPLAQQQIRIELIDFFGYAGLDVGKVRANLPIHEGDKFSSGEALNALRPKIEEVVRRVTGRAATDVVPVSPGNDVCFLFIGMSGGSMKLFSFHRAPKGTARLSATAMSIYNEADAAFSRAMQNGATSEDDSKGYSLSSGDPVLRAKQLAMHEYAARHADEISRVAREAADSSQRQIASEFLGYANRSRKQIADLVWASHDPDSGVRNNATRALAVMSSNKRVAALIPAAGFIEMLNSGNWVDRNKAGFLLLELSQWRAPKLLTQLRSQALEPLLEMAKWRSVAHAYSARMLLGRMAGIEETRLQMLAGSNDQVDVIIKAVRHQ
jgi:hypothetical protein